MFVPHLPCSSGYVQNYHPRAQIPQLHPMAPLRGVYPLKRPPRVCSSSGGGPGPAWEERATCRPHMLAPHKVGFTLSSLNRPDTTAGWSNGERKRWWGSMQPSGTASTAPYCTPSSVIVRLQPETYTRVYTCDRQQHRDASQLPLSHLNSSE